MLSAHNIEIESCSSEHSGIDHLRGGLLEIDATTFDADKIREQHINTNIEKETGLPFFKTIGREKWGKLQEHKLDVPPIGKYTPRDGFSKSNLFLTF